MKYRFILEQRHRHPVKRMCRLLETSKSGFYAWRDRAPCKRRREDQRLLTLIRDSFEGSHACYGSPRVLADLQELGETCGRRRVARLMREHGLRAQRPYRKPGPGATVESPIAPNRLERRFTVAAPNRVWVTDITYVRTAQGWLYLAVVIDLFARKVVGWSMKPMQTRELVLDALFDALRRRRPGEPVLVHSDQGAQYGSDDWLRFCRTHRLIPSMSRRGNCWDNAVAESFFGSLKKERIRKRLYRTRELARADVFDYIEAFYNRRRRHSTLGGVSPEDYEAAWAAS